MIKLFKNCNTLYFKKTEIFNDLILNNDNIFKGKFIISDFPELNRICSIYGIIHILNTNIYHIPNEKIDFIITDNSSSSDLDANIVKAGLTISILYLDLKKKNQQVWCGICNRVYTHENNHPLGRYCSEKCMKKENGVSDNGTMKTEIVKDLGLNNIVSKIMQLEKEKEKEDSLILEFDKSLSDKRIISNIKKTVDKFQSSMVKDAIRLEYAFKRESYKREMRQPSLRKASLSEKKERKNSNSVEDEEISPTTRLCKGITKKGVQCTNKSLQNSLYCGILSHSMEFAGGVMTGE